MDLNKVERLAKMELEQNVPDSQRLTQWYGDYNMYEPKSDVTGQNIEDRIKELSGQGGIMGKRLFVDLDGTCALWQPVAEEQLFEKGYYRNLPEYENVVAAVNHIVENHPDIEVFVLSKYLTNSDYALQEKDEWVSEHLPGIDEAHRIFVPYEMDKRDMIPDHLRNTDYLLDDYTKNFDNWQPPAHGIKLLNGINHTRGTWQDNRISLMRDPKDFAECIVGIIEKGEQVRDKTPQEVQEETSQEYAEAVKEALESCEEPDLNIEM